MSIKLINSPIFLGQCLVVLRPSRVTPTGVYFSLNGQFSPGYTKDYFQLEVFAGAVLNTGNVRCDNLPALASVATRRYSNLTGRQENIKVPGSWNDGTYFFSYPVPFADRVNITLNGTQIATMDFSFNTQDRYLDVLYLGLGVVAIMTAILLFVFSCLRRAGKVYPGSDKPGSSFIAKVPQPTPLSRAPSVNSKRPGANCGDLNEFEQELERQGPPEDAGGGDYHATQGSSANNHTNEEEASSEDDEEPFFAETELRTQTVYVGADLDRQRLSKPSRLSDTVQKIFKNTRTPRQERKFSEAMMARRLRFANIMRDPPRKVTREATNMLRGNETEVAEADLDEAQRKAIGEMKMAALVKYKSFVPRSYLAVAVWLEGTVCHTEEFERCFGLDVFDAAKVIHKFLVETVPPSVMKNVDRAHKTPRDRSLIRDGFHFATLAIAHLVLVAMLSSGLFISRQMRTSLTTSISLAVAVALVFILPFMTAMSENCSYYLYQGLYGLVPVVMVRDLTAGVCISSVPATISAAIAILVTGDIILGVAVGTFAFFFGTFMLLYTMLYLFNGPYDDVIIPTGRNFGFVMVLLLIFLVPFMMSMVITPDVQNQVYWTCLHIVSMVMCNLVTAWKARRLSKAWQAWLPERIHLAHRMKHCNQKQFQERLKRLNIRQRREALYIVNAKQLDRSTWAKYQETSGRAFWDYFYIEVNSLRKRAAGQIENPICMAFDLFSGRMFHTAMLFLLLLLSSLPVFLEDPTSAVSRSLNYTLLSFMFTAGFLEIFVYDVSGALDKDEDKSKIFLMPASPRIILHVQNFIYSNILNKYGTVTAKFQATAFFWALGSSMLAFLLEPTALMLTAPFSLGYDYVAYAMLSRMFFTRNPFAVRVDVASAFSVINAVIIIVVMVALIPVVSTEMSWVTSIIITALFQILRFIGIEVTAYDPSSSDFKDLSLVITFVLFKMITSVLVFGPFKHALGRNREVVFECLLQIKSSLSVSFVIGVGFANLMPQTTAALTGFVSGAIIYCHALQTLLLKPSYLLHRPLDVADVPITSGKRSLAYAEGLTETLMKQQEVNFIRKLMRSGGAKRLRFEAVADGEAKNPLVFIAQDVLQVLSESLESFSDEEEMPQLFCYMVFLLESLFDRLRFEDSVKVMVVDKFTMLSEGFIGCASGKEHVARSAALGEKHKAVNIYVGVDSKLLRSLSCCFNANRALRIRRSEDYRHMIGELVETIFHEYTETETGSHKFAVVAELVVRNGFLSEPSVYLPENIVRQVKELARGSSNDFERVHGELKRCAEMAYVERQPPSWPFSSQDWTELCQIEQEFNAELINFCETLVPKRESQKIKWRVSNWARLYYMGLTGDLEVQREIRSYLDHYEGRIKVDKFRGLLAFHQWFARPIFESFIWIFAWSCSPLYLKFRAKDPLQVGVHPSIVDIAPVKLSLTLDLRPVLFETLEAKDQGQTFIPGILCTTLDEIVLRRAKALKPYWRERSLITRGKLDNFSPGIEALLRRVLANPSKQMRKLRSCHKVPDLLIMGVAGSSILTESAPDPEKLDCVMETSGTVLYVSGGVTTCLMQLLSSEEAKAAFNFHVLCEVASASTSRIAIPPMSVTSVRTVPLHDLSPCPEKYIHSSVPYFKLSLRKHKTTTSVLKTKFFPLLRGLIYCVCDAIGDERTTDVFFLLYEYFEEYDWDASWLHPLTWKFWVKTWVSSLSYKDKYAQKVMALTISGLREGLVFFSQLLRCLCCSLPPANIYHSSHHGIGAIKGVIHKRRYKSSFVVWDHGLLLRERMAAFCEEDCQLDPFTKNSLITISFVVARIVYRNADVICPCTSCEMYKTWILKIAGVSPDSNVAKRIHPIANGAANLEGKLQYTKIENFYDNEDLNKDGQVFDPECVHACMLSHVLPIKDLQNAIRAADYLVNTRGLTCYRLHAFGALDKDPKYAATCQNLVKELKLSKHVKFHGLGPKLSVLAKADIFVNSSASEGLPCALLEASMAKVPVCCTDVGGSRQVITDPRCLAPPQDPVSLGFAQLSVLTGFKELRKGDDINQVALSDAARDARKQLGLRQYDLAVTTHVEDEVFAKHVSLMTAEALRTQSELCEYEEQVTHFNFKETHPWAYSDDEEGEAKDNFTLPRERTTSLMSMSSMQSMTESVANIVKTKQFELPQKEAVSLARENRSSTISDFMDLLESEATEREEGLVDDVSLQKQGAFRQFPRRNQGNLENPEGNSQAKEGSEDLEIV